MSSSSARRSRSASVLALVLVACAHTPPAADDPADPAPFRLGREDVVEITVFRDADLTRVVPVRPDGRISLPMAGEIEAAGKTPEELRLAVVERLKPWIEDPTVVGVIVREVNSARFYAVGECVRPGAYPVRSELTALQALALAGGLGEFSARDELVVVRAGNGKRVGATLEDLESGSVRLVVRPGDTLVVP